MPIKTLIMGAAGRDFHNFNTFFRGNKEFGEDILEPIAEIAGRMARIIDDEAGRRVAINEAQVTGRKRG